MASHPRPWPGLALALFPAGAAAMPPALVQTNLPGVMAYAPPPPGFNPLTASPQLLEAYGFPPRPEGRAAALWARVVLASRQRIVPLLRPSNLAAGAALHSLARTPQGTSTSPNWSAEVIANNATRFGPGSFRSVVGWFNVPAANQAIGACTGGEDHLFSWVGLDGWYNNEVFQAGTASDASCINGVSQQRYAAWYEWFPTLSITISNLPVTAGDAMVVWMYAQTNTTGLAFVTNATTGVGTSIQFSAPAGTTLVGNSAEWVQERPYENGILATLTNYGAAWMSGESALLYGSSTVYNYGAPGTATPLLVTMLDNSNRPISYPTPLGGAGVLFMVEGSAK